MQHVGPQVYAFWFSLTSQYIAFVVFYYMLYMNVFKTKLVPKTCTYNRSWCQIHVRTINVLKYEAAFKCQKQTTNREWRKYNVVSQFRESLVYIKMVITNYSYYIFSLSETVAVFCEVLYLRFHYQRMIQSNDLFSRVLVNVAFLVCLVFFNGNTI